MVFSLMLFSFTNSLQVNDYKTRSFSYALSVRSGDVPDLTVNPEPISSIYL
jgi:hypothetical protein